MFELKKKTELNIILFFSIFALASAFFIEYILGHKPCNLCLLQRVPYIVAIILVLLVLILQNFEKSIFLLLGLTFLFATFLSFYHFGIEQGFIEESAVCGLKNTSEITSKEELLKQLQMKTVSCKDVTFRIFGFSLTTINILISLVVIFVLTKIFTNYEKFKNEN